MKRNSKRISADGNNQNTVIANGANGTSNGTSNGINGNAAAAAAAHSNGDVPLPSSSTITTSSSSSSTSSSSTSTSAVGLSSPSLQLLQAGQAALLKSLPEFEMMSPHRRKELWMKHVRMRAEEHHIALPTACRDWLATKGLVSDDGTLDVIEKDLPRTGVHVIFTRERGQTALRNVLVAFCNFCPDIGYLQSLSLIAAQLLLVMGLNEDLALQCLVVLARHYLPGYFEEHLPGLIADIEAFHVLLDDKLPKLYSFISSLGQRDVAEPPLINLFISSWFSSLYIPLLPTAKLLRLWDSIFVDGSEFVLRFALSLFALLEPEILKMKSPLQFYQTMNSLQGMLRNANHPLFPGNAVLQVAYSIAPIPVPGLDNLRKKRVQSPSGDIILEGLPPIAISVEDSWEDLAEYYEFDERAVSDLRNSCHSAINTPSPSPDDWLLIEHAVKPFTESYQYLIESANLRDANAEPKIAEYVSGMSKEYVDSVVEKYRRWMSNDLPSEEQNQIIVGILESVLGKNKQQQQQSSEEGMDEMAKIQAEPAASSGQAHRNGVRRVQNFARNSLHGFSRTFPDFFAF